MFDSINKIKEQFLWEPEIQGEPFDFAQGKQPPKVVVCGMGGSNLGSGFLEMLMPDLEVVTHRSYGLPANAKKDDLIIISSYSGNTEEALDSFEKAMGGGFRALAISMGGELLKRAKKDGIPFIEIPEIGIEPRMALGFSLLAMLKTVGDEENLKKAREFGENFNPEEFEEEGRVLAEKLAGKMPIIYSSWANKAIAYAWKVKLCETAKIPAFFNVFPELNHSEMIGFLSQNTLNYSFIFLNDLQDHPRIQKRMEITRSMFEEKGYSCHLHALADSHHIAKIFNSLVLADWVSCYMAKNSGFDPEDISIIEEFKKKMKD